MDKIKILYVIPRLNNAGPVNQLFDLLGGLKKGIFNILIVTLYDEKEDTRFDEFKKFGYPIESLGIAPRWNFCQGVHSLNKKVEKFSPDIIHSAGLPSDLCVTIRKKKNIQYIMTSHCNIYVDYLTRFSNRFLAKGLIAMHERCMQRMDKIVCCSQSLTEVYGEKYGVKILAIQNGIDINRFLINSSDKRNNLKRKLGLDDKKMTAVVVGSLDNRKNVSFIISTLKQMTKETLQLVLLGTGPLENECRAVAEGYDILFKGKIDDVNPYLQCADVYISASKSEGLPLSVLEAGIAGKKMVLSDIPQHKEIAQYERIRGIYFFELGNKEELIKQVEVALQEPIEIEGDVSKYFRKYFSAERMANEYTKLYSERVSF